MRLHRAPREPLNGCRGDRGGGRALSDVLAGAGAARRGRRGRGGDPAARRAGARSAAMLARARPLPGPDPRRPVALATRSSTCATTPARLVALAARGARRLVALAVAFRRWPRPAAAGDRRRAPVPRPPPRRRRHREPAGPALPGDRRRSAARRPRLADRTLAAGGAGGPSGRRCARAAGPPRRARTRRQPPGCPGSWPRSSSSTPSRRSTRPTSRKRSRTSASSSSRSPSSTPCCATSSGTGGCSSLVLWVVGVEAVAFVAGRHGRVR